MNAGTMNKETIFDRLPKNWKGSFRDTVVIKLTLGDKIKLMLGRGLAIKFVIYCANNVGEAYVDIDHYIFPDDVLEHEDD